MTAERARAAAPLEIHIDARPVAMSRPTVTGADLKRLVTQQGSFQLFREKGPLEPKDGPDERIEEGDVVLLRGGMRFYTISDERIHESRSLGLPWRDGWKRRLSMRAAAIVGLAGLWIAVVGDDLSSRALVIKTAIAVWAGVAFAAWSWPPHPMAKREGGVLVLRSPWWRAMGAPSLLLVPALAMHLDHHGNVVSDVLAVGAGLAEVFQTIRLTGDAIEKRSLRRRVRIRWSDVEALVLERDLWWRPGGVVLRASEGTPILVSISLNGFCDFAARALASVPPSALRGDPRAKQVLEIVAPLAAQPDRAPARRTLVRG